jgi:hypothetical protein
VLFTGRSAVINDLFTPVFVDGKETIKEKDFEA